MKLKEAGYTIVTSTKGIFKKNVEVVLNSKQKEIGEVYKDGKEWGCFHYLLDNGCEGHSSREDAIDHLMSYHSDYISDLKRKIGKVSSLVKKLQDYE